MRFPWRFLIAEAPLGGVYEFVQNPFHASRRAWLWPIVMAALIFWASGQSNLGGPSIPGIDKVTHFSVYGLLATLVVRLGHSARSAWISLLIISGYGLTDEWHQSFTPGRSVELADWLADTAGAAMAILLYRKWTWYRLRLETPLEAKPASQKPSAVATVAAP